MGVSEARIQVLVYVGPGAGPMSSAALLSVLPLALPKVHIRAAQADELRDGAFHSSTAALVFPGGIDRPMIEALGEPGFQSIRDFVRDGGCYLGICAGAYFAANICEFQCEDGSMIGGPRPLRFFPGTAIGPLRSIAPKFDGDDETTAATANLILSPGGAGVTGVYWGGPSFEAGSGDLAGTGGWRILARYEQAGGRVAAVDCGFGRGRAVLSGVHPEFALVGSGGVQRVVRSPEPTPILLHLLRAAGLLQ